MSAGPRLAIVGAAAAPSRDAGTLTPAGLMAEAAAAAMRDAAVTKDQIDGLFSASAYYYLPQMTLGDHLDIRPTYSDSSNIGGCSFIAHLSHAAAAIDAGLCRVGLIAYASTQRSDGRRLVKSMSEPLAYEVPYGSMWPLTGFAMMARRHMAQFGTTQRQLAEIAVAAREWALLNPQSGQTRPLSVAEVVESPEICAPLRRLDCCLVSDGAGALVVTSPEMAADLTDSPVYVWSVAETHDSRYTSRLPDYVTSPAAQTGPRALEGAGVTLDDIDVFEVYDAFTIAVLIALEDLGFCGKGEGGPFVEDGRLRPGGWPPLNTGGGGLSNRHPGMLGMELLLEAVTQLRHEGGGRQVPQAQTALVHGLGAIHMSGATAVLSRPDWAP